VTAADRTAAGSTRLRVRVAPGASRAEVVGRVGDAWKLRVRAAPERGLANDAVVALLAESLGVARRDVRIVAGQTGRDKVVELERMRPEDAERLLAAAGRDRT
jgi:uncharacterized protein